MKLMVAARAMFEPDSIDDPPPGYWEEMTKAVEFLAEEVGDIDFDLE